MEEALSWLEKAAEWRPDHARTHYNRGLMLDRLGRKDEALAALEQGRRQAPGDPDLLYALGRKDGTISRIDDNGSVATATLGGPGRFVDRVHRLGTNAGG